MTFEEKYSQVGNITLKHYYSNREPLEQTIYNIRALVLHTYPFGGFEGYGLNSVSGNVTLGYSAGYGCTQEEFNTFYPTKDKYVWYHVSLTSYDTWVRSEIVSNENNIPIIIWSNDSLTNVPYTETATVSGTEFQYNTAYNSVVNTIVNTYLYHDIYIDGVDEANNIYIHTHHNIDYGRVTSYGYYSFERAGNIFNANSNEGNYDRLGNSQYDKGMIQDFTYEKLLQLGIDNTRAKEWESNFPNGVAIKFNDNIVSESYPTGDNHYTNYAVIQKNKNHLILPNTSGEAISSLVTIRFFDGVPPKEVQENSDSGDDRDETNYDGSPKDPRTQDDYDDEGELNEGSDEGSAGIFNDIYKVTDANMKSLHNKIWSQDYFNVLKVNSNPIENVLSCKRFPFDMTGGTDTEITIGNIATGVNGSPISKGIYRVDIGSIYVGEKFKCFLDYYQTNYSIYLPFIGLKQLQATQIVGHTIIIKYIVDIMTGVCKAQLFLDSTNFLFAEYDGLMGIDCTLTSSNQKQAELVNATRFINAGVSFATGNPMGIASAITGLTTNGVENHFQSTQSNSAIGNASVIDCYLIYDEPQVPIANGVYPNNYAKTVGLPCGKSYKIGECSGYIKCGGDVQGTFTRATSEEVDEIMNLLQNGIEV